jgi:K+-transporting ATPase c subunit
MTRRTRKLIGAFVIMIFVVVYALVAMALAQARFVQEASGIAQGLIYAGLGMGWIIPIMR